MANNNNDTSKSVRVTKELHELLIEIKDITGVPAVKYISKAVQAMWEKEKKDYQ